jgi:outer membrane protein assembly factor BamB
VLGRWIVEVDRGQRGSVVLRLHDIHTGKAKWEKSFPAGAVVMRTEEPNLIGVLESAKEGKVTVWNVYTDKVVLSSQVDPKDLDRVQEIHLLADKDWFFLACNRTPAQQQINPGVWVGGGVYPNVMNGLRCLPVNGAVHAFERDTGKFNWKAEVPSQMLILDQYRDLPVLIFTAYQQRMAGGPNQGIVAPVAVTLSFEKRTGKLIFRDEYPNRQNQFYALVANVKAGTVEMIGYQLKIVYYLEGSTGEKSETRNPNDKHEIRNSKSEGSTK